MDEAIIIGVCLVLNALLAAFEMAFVSVSKPELRQLARKHNKVASRLLEMRDAPERTLSVIQVGITLVGAIAAAVGGAGATETLEPYFMEHFGMNELTAEIISVILVVLPLTYLSVVVGELVPKTLALRWPLAISMKGSRPVYIADRVLSPVISLLERSTKAILFLLLRGKTRPSEANESQSLEIDSLSPMHKNLVLNMFKIEQKRIQDVMLPWEKVQWLDSRADMNEVMSRLLISGHTRMPVLENGEIQGFLHSKEFVALKEAGAESWKEILRPCLIIRSWDSALSVFKLMQARRNHMAVVFSSSNQCIGLVTMEDILEEVVGEIYDEDDDGKIHHLLAGKRKGRGFGWPLK